MTVIYTWLLFVCFFEGYEFKGDLDLLQESFPLIAQIRHNINNFIDLKQWTPMPGPNGKKEQIPPASYRGLSKLVEQYFLCRVE